MSTPNRRQKRGPLKPTQSSQTESGSWIGLIVLVAIIGLTVMTPLQPSEGAAEKGSSALLIVAWLAVAAFSQLAYAFWSRPTEAAAYYRQRQNGSNMAS